jgi:hypothetical protein
MAEIEAHGLRFFDLEAVDELRAFLERPDDGLLDANVRAARGVYGLELLPRRLENVLARLELTHHR